jgi:hypothetical protein
MHLPSSRWHDPAFWVAVIGPLVGTSFLTYFTFEIMRALPQ